jgi:hypothetical protein
LFDGVLICLLVLFAQVAPISRYVPLKILSTPLVVGFQCCESAGGGDELTEGESEPWTFSYQVFELSMFYIGLVMNDIHILRESAVETGEFN